MIPVQYEVSTTERNEILKQFPPPNMVKHQTGFNIEDEGKGNVVKVQVILNEYSIEKTKSQKPYLKMRFSNHLGTVSAKMWDNDGAVDTHTPLLEEYSVFEVEGIVDEFNGFKSITINKLNPCTDEVDPFSLLACTQHNVEDLTVELHTYLNDLNEPYRELGLKSLSRVWDDFKIRPAAKGHHHNYLGGLLKHTVGLMRFARFILKFEENHFKAVLKLIQRVEKVYKEELWNDLLSEDPGTNPRNLVWKDTIDHLYSMFYGMAKYKTIPPNYDSLMISILFHDMGKLLEYHHAGRGVEEFKLLFPTADHTSLHTRKPSGITMDDLGVLVGHIPYGLMLLSKMIELENIKLPIEDIHSMLTQIASHHAKQEWGSLLKNPMSIESYLIHICDYLDSRYENTEEIK